jgi:hypothetical protein
MNHEDVADLLGAFALDAVDGRDKDAVRDHLDDCPRCQAELSEYHEVAGLLANVGGDAPAQVWDRIAERVSVVGGRPKSADRDSKSGGNVVHLVRPASDARERKPSKHVTKKALRWAMPAATAAALVVIGLLGAQVAHLNSRVGKLDAVVASHGMSQVVQAALLNPHATHVDLTSAVDRGASLGQIIVLPSGTAFMINSDMPGLPDGETYQLWGRNGATMISISLLGNQPKDVALTIDPTAHFGGFAVTVEPAGGVVKPTTSPVAVGALA